MPRDHNKMIKTRYDSITADYGSSYGYINKSELGKTAAAAYTYDKILLEISQNIIIVILHCFVIFRQTKTTGNTHIMTIRKTELLLLFVLRPLRVESRESVLFRSTTGYGRTRRVNDLLMVSRR